MCSGIPELRKPGNLDKSSTQGNWKNWYDLFAAVFMWNIITCETRAGDGTCIGHNRGMIRSKMTDTVTSRGRTLNVVPSVASFWRIRAHSHFIALSFSYTDGLKRKMRLDVFWQRMGLNWKKASVVSAWVGECTDSALVCCQSKNALCDTVSGVESQRESN